jgi:hypothetical protein
MRKLAWACVFGRVLTLGLGLEKRMIASSLLRSPASPQSWPAAGTSAASGPWHLWLAMRGGADDEEDGKPANTEHFRVASR